MTKYSVTVRDGIPCERIDFPDGSRTYWWKRPGFENFHKIPERQKFIRVEVDNAIGGGAPVGPPLRACRTCKQEKELSSFFRDATQPAGRSYRCKDCTALNPRKHSASTKEKVRQREAFRVLDKKKVAAKQAVRTAVMSGRLYRWPVCAVPECENTKVYGHHADYDNQLGVTWLCARHHTLTHNILRNKP